MEIQTFLHAHPILLALFPFVAIWTIVWKGWALWRAARLKQQIWFIVLLVVNTLGILEIIYLFLVTKPEGSSQTVVDSGPGGPPSSE